MGLLCPLTLIPSVTLEDSVLCVTKELFVSCIVIGSLAALAYPRMLR